MPPIIDNSVPPLLPDSGKSVTVCSARRAPISAKTRRRRRRRRRLAPPPVWRARELLAQTSALPLWALNCKSDEAAALATRITIKQAEEQERAARHSTSAV